MAQNTIGWPRFGGTDSYIKLRFAQPLQSDGNLSYLEFISAVKSIWEESFPNYPIKSSSSGDPSFTWFNPNYVDPETGQNTGRYEETDAIITYSLELRKTHSVEPKPRMRQITSNDVYIYGQRFQNIIAFTAMSPVGKRLGANPNSVIDDQDNAYLVESLMETFEDFMLEYTPIFKKIGASELTYSRRLADSEVNRDQKDVHKRTVTYMLTTEKLFAAKSSTVESVAVDVRLGMAYEQELINQLATPNYEGTSLNIVDLSQAATPNV
jgi:hypothetical protein